MADAPPKRIESRLSGFLSRLSFRSSSGSTIVVPAPAAAEGAEKDKDKDKDSEQDKRKLAFRTLGKSSGSLVVKQPIAARASTEALDIALPKSSSNPSVAPPSLSSAPAQSGVAKIISSPSTVDPKRPKSSVPPPELVPFVLIKTASMEISNPSLLPRIPSSTAPLTKTPSADRAVPDLSPIHTPASSAPSSARSVKPDETGPDDSLVSDRSRSSIDDGEPLHASTSEGMLSTRLFNSDRIAQGLDSSDKSTSSRSSPSSEKILHTLKGRGSSPGTFPGAVQANALSRSSTSGDLKSTTVEKAENPPSRQKSLESLNTITPSASGTRTGTTRRSKERRRHPTSSTSSSEKKSSASAERPKLVKKNSAKTIQTLDRNFRSFTTMSLNISTQPPRPKKERTSRPKSHGDGSAPLTQSNSASSDPPGSDDDTLAVNLTASRSRSPPSKPGSRRNSSAAASTSTFFAASAPLRTSNSTSFTAEDFEIFESEGIFPSSPLSMIQVEELCRNPNQLLDAILSRDQSFLSLMADVLDVHSFERMTKALLVLFEASGRSLHLLRWAVTREMISTASSTTLFREDGLTCRLISVYSRQGGLAYLRSVLQPLVKKLAQSSTNYEVDPKRADKKSDLKSNLRHLRKISEKFLAAILESAPLLPRSLRLLYALLMTRCPMRFPEMAAHLGVGALYFLRFVCPALVDPVGWGLLDKQPQERGKRGLVLVAKVLQNLANGVEFGEKESFLLELNDLIASYGNRVREFLCSLALREAINNAPAAEPIEVDTPQGLEALSLINQCCVEHIPMFREKLSSTPLPFTMSSFAAASASSSSASSHHPSISPSSSAPPMSSTALHNSGTPLESSDSSVPRPAELAVINSDPLPITNQSPLRLHVPEVSRVRPRSHAVAEGLPRASGDGIPEIVLPIAPPKSPHIAVAQRGSGGSGSDLHGSGGIPDEILLMSLQMEPPTRPLPALPSPSSNSSSLSVSTLLPQSTSFVLQTPPHSPHAIVLPSAASNQQQSDDDEILEAR